MHAVHKKFGLQWKGRRKGTYKPRQMDAVADSGCQTCSAGIDVLEKIGCPLEYLAPTSHRIVGITESSLDITGSVFLRIEVAGRITRQMVHVSKNTRGLYLSESALIELGVLPGEFPKPPKANGSSINQAPSEPTKNAAACDDEAGKPCIERTPTPDRPPTIPFAPTKENLPKFEQWFLSSFASSAFNDCTHQPLQGMSGQPMEIGNLNTCTHRSWGLIIGRNR